MKRYVRYAVVFVIAEIVLLKLVFLAVDALTALVGVPELALAIVACSLVPIGFVGMIVEDFLRGVL